MVYGKEHKIILQTVMNEGALLENRVNELIMKLFDHNNTTKILREINAKLQPLYMTIKCINCEVTGQLYWIFVNTVEDKTTSLQSEFSQAELSLLRSVFSEIVTSNSHCISSTFCLNLCSSLNQKLTKTSAEEFLHEMVIRKWLCSKGGKYYMGVRSIAELLQYFKDTYEEKFKICSLCKQELLYGQKCNNCNAVTHIHCLENCTRTDGLGCPSCHQPMPELSHNQSDYANCTMDVDIENVLQEVEMTEFSQVKG
ncbi:hypothetical protein PUN28_009671 [Cardiocondyla obscurior]|uniref:Non-structural maintenance of chromosomes element 1 homolog n=1 Tax=Cardiocondyla obscurior TaxID=286306 RepID=A0AAW2FTF0_9HYME